MKKNSVQDKNFFFLFLVILFWFAQYVYIPFQTTFLLSQGVSSERIGLIISAYGLTQIILRLPIGILADKMGKHKFFIFLGLLFAGLASFVRLLFPTADGFLIANLLSGVASSMWISFMVFYGNYFPPEEQSAVIGYIIAAFNFGMLLGFIVSTFFYSILGMPFLCLMSLFSGFIGAGLSLKIREISEPSKKISVLKLATIGKNKRLLFFSFLAFIQQGIQMATAMSFTTKFLIAFNASNLQIGMSSVIYMLSAFTFSILSTTTFFRKKSNSFWIPISFLVLAIYCVSLPYAPTILIILLLQILPGIGTGLLFSYLTSEAMIEIPKEKRSTAMGYFQSIYAIGMTIFPTIVGGIINSYSLKLSYFFLALCAIVGVISSILFYVFQRKF